VLEDNAEEVEEEIEEEITEGEEESELNEEGGENYHIEGEAGSDQGEAFFLSNSKQQIAWHAPISIALPYICSAGKCVP